MSEKTISAEEAVIYTTTMFKQAYKDQETAKELNSEKGKNLVFDLVEKIWHEHGQTEDNFCFCLDKAIDLMVKANSDTLSAPQYSTKDIIDNWNSQGLLDKSRMVSMLNKGR